MNGNVLLVEDELLVALVLEKFLVSKGFNIIGPFTTGKEAIECLGKYDFQFAFLDIQLEDKISGIEVGQAIRKQSEVPIVFSTGNERSQIKSLIAELGSQVYFVPKPVDFDRLERILAGTEVS